MKTFQEIRDELEIKPENLILTKIVNGETVQCSTNDRSLILDDRAQTIFNRQITPVMASFRGLAFVLLKMGIYEQVKLSAISTPEGEIWWNTSQGDMVRRDHPFISSLASSLGLSGSQIDDMFSAAQSP